MATVQMQRVAVSPQEQANIDAAKKHRIQVSNTKKPLFFYVNLAKRYIEQHDEVELSALGMAITTVVTIAEILKNNGLAIEKKVSTSTVGMKDENKGRLVQKAKIEIVLGKSEKFDAIMKMNAAILAPEAVAEIEIVLGKSEKFDAIMKMNAVILAPEQLLRQRNDNKQ